jgi:hypothetical protein
MLHGRASASSIAVRPLSALKEVRVTAPSVPVGGDTRIEIKEGRFRA